MKRAWLLIIAAVLLMAFLVVVALIIGPVANASVTSQPRETMDGKLWLIGNADLASIGNAGSWTWITCGVTAATCPSPGVTAFANYRKLRDAILSGVLDGQTVLFDEEGWIYAPAWQKAHPGRYLSLAGQLARKHHVYLIEAPTGDGGATPALRQASMIAMDVIAARYASAVDIQRQAAVSKPKMFAAFTRKDVTAMRKISKTVTIIDGIGTDSGNIPATPAELLKSYELTRRWVQGFWLNIPVWSPNKCTAAQGGPGCPAVAEAFLAAIGGAS